jgi:hypothetical protein
MSHQITASKLLINLTGILSAASVLNRVGLPLATERGLQADVPG